MKAMVIRQYGGPEVFEMVEIDKPEPKPGYVLVKVMASSLNPLETKIRSGLAASLGPALPAILNADVAGEIVAVGEGVQWQPGDQVFGCAGGVGTLPGALAEYMLADARLLARKPANIDYATAALFPLVSLTAWEGIMEKSLAQAGEKLLLHGAAGGVGHIALQLAKQQGLCTGLSQRRPRRTLPETWGRIMLSWPGRKPLPVMWTDTPAARALMPCSTR